VRRLRGFGSLIIIVAMAVGGLAYTFAVGNSPLLGLDLQGGVSVVLKPTTPADEETLNQAIRIIRQRIDALGVAEPEITRQGDNILIQIPGVDDRDRALELVGQTAELQFRPVLSAIPAGLDLSDLQPEESTTTTATTAPTASTAGSGEQGLAPSSALGTGELAASDEPSPPVTVSDGPIELAQGEAPTTDTTAPGATDTTVPSDPTATTVPPTGLTTLPEDICSTGIPSADLPADQQVEVPQCDDGVLVATYVLGPVALTGNALSGASAQLGGELGTEWVVNPTFKGGADGIDQFNAVAAQCFAAQAACPSGQLAIVLDGRVISAPTIERPAFDADQITISGSFDEGGARDLATSLRYGALPVELEQQQAQIVSATLGRDALRAGVIAGLVGLALSIVYMVAFYRFLGVLAICKLAVEGALLWTVIAYLGTNSGLALTLAGVTGIIVSIGVSLDSNVVYYEHLREDVRNGRTIRSATDKSFHSAFSTIVKADVASLIGAFLLYWLTVGPVRGFAFYLGVAGILDLICSWAFMRPSVKLATRSSWLRARPKVLGLPEERPSAVTPTSRSTVGSGASR
jgi:preprotein translocase subunit SecD